MPVALRKPSALAGTPQGQLIVRQVIFSNNSQGLYLLLVAGLLAGFLGCESDASTGGNNYELVAGTAGDDSTTDTHPANPSGGTGSVEGSAGEAGNAGAGGEAELGMGGRPAGKGGATAEPEGGASGEPMPVAKCGNGRVTGDELCDDGDRLNTTGCLTDCSGCAAGYELVGTVCQALVVSCPDEDPCAPHGICDDSTGELVCACKTGYEGDTCADCSKGYHSDDGTCVVDEECLETSCSGNGVCDIVSGLVVCACYGGYAGARCADCEPGFHDVDGTCVVDQKCTDTTCGGHGECDVVDGLAVCTCSERYGGPRCKQCAAGYHMSAGDCVADEECLETSCAGHGECTTEAGFVVCECEDGYAGETCTDCVDGYHGTEDGGCAVDERCGTDTCPSNATCKVVGGLVSCSCTEGYAGDDCASCATGYHSASGRCALDQVCTASSCSGGGTCSIENGLVACECDNRHTGSACQYCAAGYVLTDGGCTLDTTAVVPTCSDGDPCSGPVAGAVAGAVGCLGAEPDTSCECVYWYESNSYRWGCYFTGDDDQFDEPVN